MFVTFIPRVCKYPDPKGPVGGATSPIGREKRGRVFLRIRTFAHAGRPFSLKLKGLWSDSAALLGVALQQEEEEEVEAMVGGWRKMAAV